LETKELAKSFGKFQALSGVSLSVAEGGLSALIGPNGSGKTTFYNVVSGRYQPTAGTVRFQGKVINKVLTHKLVGRGLLRSFQITNIFPDLTVLENVLTPLVVHHNMGFRFLSSIGRQLNLVEEAEQILDKVGLRSEAHKTVHTLAYGDKRLVEIAIVLARNPKLVMLDEPTAGMNPEETDRMVKLIKELSETSGTTFLITEHDMKVVFSVADRIFVLNQGRLLAEGTPEAIRENEQVKQAYLGGSLDASGV
jgi:branched-chain amino acid transport system ATP-binding protein